MSNHPLKSWIVNNGVTQADLARELRCSEAHISDVLNYKKTPSLDLAGRMSRLTQGEVPVVAFLPPVEEVACEKMR